MNLGSNLFYGCTELKTVRWQGTHEQWESVGKASDWMYGAESVQVVCAEDKNP